MTGPLDTVEIVRGRLANGLTIADSDVHKLLAKIDQLQARLRWRDNASREMLRYFEKAEAERDEARKELAATQSELKSYEASLVEWVDFTSGVIQDRTDLRKELEELLGVADWVCAGFRQGGCKQHMYSRLAPATGKARALLRDMTIGSEET